MVEVFVPVSQPLTDWAKLFTLAKNHFNGINITAQSDKEKKPLNNHISFLNAIENLGDETTLAETSRHEGMLNHVFYSFFFIMDELTVKDIVVNSDFNIYCRTYPHQRGNYDYGLMSGTLSQWRQAIVNLCKLHPEIGNGMYKAFNVLGLGFIFTGYLVVHENKTFYLETV